jgi:cytochrome c biogenesis protein CcmG, thiol:disulfide interchange protein DsbE
VLAAHGAAGAEPPAIASLLKPLDLKGYAEGVRPPNFTAHTLDERPLSLSDLRGRVVILNFWASWCVECRPELPVLERLHRDLGPRGLTVVGVNAREASATVRRYADSLGLSFPLVLDPDGKVNVLYGVIGLPSTFLVGRDGRAVALAIGPREWASASGRAIIEAMLAEPTQAQDGR